MDHSWFYLTNYWVKMAFVLLLNGPSYCELICESTQWDIHVVASESTPYNHPMKLAI